MAKFKMPTIWQISGIVLGILVLLGGVLYAYWPRVERLTISASLFSGAEQYENFNRLYRIFPSTQMAPSEQAVRFEKGAPLRLPETFIWGGKAVNTDAFLQDTDTVALLVLHSGKRVYEEYWLTGAPDTRWLSMSVAKSFISALVGIAINEGYIRSIEDPVTQYVPELAGSAYDKVRIKDILQMSSGARWNEDYSDSDSDINRFSRAFALGSSLNEFAATLVGEFPPGTYNRYNSVDTQVLGMLLLNATGRKITDYMQQKLWQPLGAEYSAYWLTDDSGMELVFGGMNATARDYAKLGELYRLGGRFNGQQIVPKNWVRASVKPDAPHLMPGKDNKASDFPLGYGYQWWVPEGDDGVFTAIGVYNQFIYVHPARKVVIVKLSANSSYGTQIAEWGSADDTDRELETLGFLRIIAEAAAP